MNKYILIMLLSCFSLKAQKTIHSLSKLMRYLLQNSDVENINLQEEIDFLNKYIELMSMRIGAKTEVSTSFPKNIPDVYIKPLLFISIVENAFKHGVSATKNSAIFFKIRIIDNKIEFTAENSFFPKNKEDKSGSGIGVENLKKRLNILYPNRHFYDSYVKDDKYCVLLIIETI